jgi:hypothetical protein
MGSGQFLVSGRVDDYGPTGQGTPSTIFTFTPQKFSNADLTSDAAVWPCLLSLSQ